MRVTLAERIRSVTERAEARALISSAELWALSAGFARSGGELLYLATELVDGWERIEQVLISFGSVPWFETTVPLEHDAADDEWIVPN
jgi:hypothetical protein